jgi:hypothetical protein
MKDNEKQDATRYDSFLASMNQRINNDIDSIRKIIEHKGEKGVRIERIVESLVRLFLPNRYSLRSGFLMDHQGNISPQQDIIVTDEHSLPRLFSDDIQILHPADSAVATIEVKTSLDKAGLKEAFSNIQNTRNSMKWIFGEGKILTRQGPNGTYTSASTSRRVIPEPPSVIIGYKSPKIDTLLGNISALVSELSIENMRRFDLLYIIDTGTIIGWQPEGVPRSAFYRPANDRRNKHDIKAISANLTESDRPIVSAFVIFMRLLNGYIKQMQLPDVDAVLQFYSGFPAFNIKSWSGVAEKRFRDEEL